jgi:hypothetical protein
MQKYLEKRAVVSRSTPRITLGCLLRDATAGEVQIHDGLSDLLYLVAGQTTFVNRSTC